MYVLDAEKLRSGLEEVLAGNLGQPCGLSHVMRVPSCKGSHVSNASELVGFYPYHTL